MAVNWKIIDTILGKMYSCDFPPLAPDCTV